MSALTEGQTVRRCAELTHDWYEGRAADGVAYAPGPQVGRITKVCREGGFCALCDYHDRDCPGPWYLVDFGDGEANGFGGLYGACELAPA